jgi:chemotaxis protein MotA
MDWGSLAGLALAIGGVLIGQMMEGGHAGSLLQPAALLIVMVGTLGAVLLQTGFATFLRALRMARLVFSPPADDHARLSRAFVFWSTSARREGMLSLERMCDKEPDPFIGKGLRLIVDGIDADRLRLMLEQDINAWERRERAAVKVWEAAGGYAPTMGILGAVLGLIHVMENLGEPGKLGSGIAVAFVATIYGVGLANLVFLPIAGRLKAQVQREVCRRELMSEALAGLAAGENPRIIEGRMAAWAA